MGIIESEAEAIAWAHQMAKTPTTGDHEVADPHPYCLGDDPCCCVQLIAACETARADERELVVGRVEAVITQGVTVTTKDGVLTFHLIDYEDRLRAAIREAE